MIVGHLAVATEDPAERRAALAEGEDLLGRGAVSHNHLWFHRHAMEASVAAGAWDEALRYAAALETHTKPEPFRGLRSSSPLGERLPCMAAATAVPQRSASCANYAMKPGAWGSSLRCRHWSRR